MHQTFIPSFRHCLFGEKTMTQLLYLVRELDTVFQSCQERGGVKIIKINMMMTNTYKILIKMLNNINMRTIVCKRVWMVKDGCQWRWMCLDGCGWVHECVGVCNV